MAKTSKRPFPATTGKCTPADSGFLREIVGVSGGRIPAMGTPRGVTVFCTFCKKAEKLALNAAEIEKSR